MRYAAPLGSATPAAPCTQPQAVNMPYIATTTPALPQLLPQGVAAATDRARFGLGAAPHGIWNFAFGANMSPRKLGGSRGLHPLESQPAVLKGYRLAFNHRGGFGNIVPCVQQVSGQNNAAPAGDNSGTHTEGGVVRTEAGAATAQQAAAAQRAAARGQQGEVVGAWSGSAVHGVLHRFTPADLADLMCCEHEYEPVVVLVEPYAANTAAPQAAAAGAPAAAAAALHTAAADSARASEVTAAARAPERATITQSNQQQPATVVQQERATQQQPPSLVPAIAFMTPPERCTQEGLPPKQR